MIQLIILDIVVEDRTSAANDLERFCQIPGAVSQDEYDFADRICGELCISKVPVTESADQFLLR